MRGGEKASVYTLFERTLATSCGLIRLNVSTISFGITG